MSCALDFFYFLKKFRTLKKRNVAPRRFAPYFILPSKLARSSADLIGFTMVSTTRKAARLAVYDDTMMRQKNHHDAAIIRVDIPLRT